MSVLGKVWDTVIAPPELPETPEIIETKRPFVITDYKTKSRGGEITPWVSLVLNSGVHEVEVLYKDRYVFIARNEGNNLAALKLWVDGFSTELDFPRLAAARIEKRFCLGVPYPDNEYGAFFVTLVRDASDLPWTGAQREDDFWVLKKYAPGDNESEKESWEFLIMVTMKKETFTSQLDSVFQNVNPSPAPTKAQRAAAARVRDHFFEGF